MQFIRKQKRRTPVANAQPSSAASPSATEAGTSSSSGDRLVLLGNDDHYIFDLNDLLRASAEVLGKGSIGTSYKAVLENGIVVAVKRLKDVFVTQAELDMHMDVLGKIRHDKLAPFRGYYFSKDEKLLISDYMASGSLWSSLHGDYGLSSLDWETRKKIALCAAEGIAHLHVIGKLVHGNIKSANIYFGQDHNVLLFDFGLNVLFGSGTLPNRMAGYCAPEIMDIRKVTFQSYVYSFGVLLFELLTGKDPNQASLADAHIDLPRWVQSVVRDEWTDHDVFDTELISTTAMTMFQMVSLLQVAMSCVSPVPEQRPNIQEVVRLIRDLDQVETRNSDMPTNVSSKENDTKYDVNANKLVYLGVKTNSLDWQDRLGGSDDCVLGVGSLGVSFKAGLKDGTTIVVKLIRSLSATKSEFDSQMRVLESIKQDDVVSVRAYHFSEHEKLLVSDYITRRSLYSTLHGMHIYTGGRGPGQASLDWENRKNIALCTAKAIANLHISGELVHGNIKSSNVFLRTNQDVMLSDFGLNALLGSAHPPNWKQGYCAPEVLEAKDVTFQSDVYSLGILFLELLTRKLPGQGSLNLATRVRSVGREEWTTKVFDAELTSNSNNIEGEMVSLLQIAMACVSNAPDHRPSIQDVVCLIENLIISVGVTPITG